jgi:phosphoglycerate dehydrogenase-like enzyme
VAFADLNAAMHDADIVVAAVPSNDDTTGMFNKEKFAAMQQGCLFINVGRGTAVVEADLIASLESGHLGGAAVDVASEEPLPPDNALWNSPVRISAHCSATLPNTMRRVHELFFRNIAKFATGERFENEVDL